MGIRADTFLIKLQYLAVVGIVVSQALGMNGVSSLLFTLTFAGTVCLWIIGAAKGISRTGALAVGIVLVSFVCVVLNALLSGSGGSFPYYKKLVIFWASVLFFSAVCECEAEESVIRFVLALNGGLAVFLILMYGLQNQQMHLFNGNISDYLTFQFENPNLAGVFLSCICMTEIIGAVRSGEGWQRAAHILLAAAMARFVAETRSRNSLLSLALFAVALLLLGGSKRPWRGYRLGAGGMAVLPLVFALAYLVLIPLPEVQKILGFFVGEGKKLTSRVGIWSFALEAFAHSPLIGAYSQISDGTGQSQMHNTHLDILASYGIVVLVMLCVLLYQILCRAGCRRMGAGNRVCLLAFAAVLLSGIGEAMLFSGGLGIYIYAGVFLLMANRDFEGEDLVT